MEKYEIVEIEVIILDNADIITTSDGNINTDPTNSSNSTENE